MYGDYFNHKVLEGDQDTPEQISDQSPEASLHRGSEDLDPSGIDNSPQAARGRISESPTKDTRRPILRKQKFVIC